VDRPNRFLVRCRAAGRTLIEAFLPNPGRLWECLLPGATLYLTSDTNSAGRSQPRKTAHTVLAVERGGAPVFLHTHLTNQVARYLVENDLVPPLRGARVVRSEVKLGNSRFDLLLRQGKREMLAEVKSCTLFGNGVAMFPDAVTERGTRHLVELASLGTTRDRNVVLFLIHTPSVRWFMPDYHTDLAFSEALLRLRDRLDVLPVAVGWRPDLSLGPDVKMVDIPWAHLRREVKDGGSYLVLARLSRRRLIQVGGLGGVRFPRGWYVYVGSAMRNLSARIARHCRRRKKLRWHIDYLLQEADEVIPLPIRSSRRRECEIARAVGSIMQPGPAGFGSSDCACGTHLFHAREHPLQSGRFHVVLQCFRMTPPEDTPS